jgi:type IV pilus assembly protein PilX
MKSIQMCESHRVSPMRAQRGIVMFVALAVLILMTLAGLAMLRQMGGAVSIAGNLAFKQTATSVADVGTEAARAWFTAPGRDLAADSATNGYYATWSANVDPTTFPWSTAPSVSDAATGNTVQYITHRLCQLKKDANAPDQQCSSEGGGGSDKGGGGPGGFTTLTKPYFRVTSKVTGPRNTVSYIQVVLRS